MFVRKTTSGVACTGDGIAARWTTAWIPGRRSPPLERLERLAEVGEIRGQERGAVSPASSTRLTARDRCSGRRGRVREGPGSTARPALPLPSGHGDLHRLRTVSEPRRASRCRRDCPRRSRASRAPGRACAPSTSRPAELGIGPARRRRRRPRPALQTEGDDGVARDVEPRLLGDGADGSTEIERRFTASGRSIPSTQ